MGPVLSASQLHTQALHPMHLISKVPFLLCYLPVIKEHVGECTAAGYGW